MRLLLLLGLSFAAVWDWRARRIPNWLTLVLAGAGLMAQVIEGQALGGVTFASAAVGMLLALVVLLPFYALGWMGAGDVKLGMALAIWLGWQNWLMVWALANLLALAHSLWQLGRRSVHWQALTGMVGLQTAPTVTLPRRSSPYGSYLCLATVLVLMWGR